MKAVQTFYSYADEASVIHDSAGFLSPDMNWKSMALSCLLLKKHFGKVTLYCNQRVSELVSEIFQIPYDHIVQIPDFMERYTGCDLWALPKIYTYSKQTAPFIHVDCDWFMFEKLSERILKSDLIGQNIEYDDQMYNRRTLEKFISNGCEFPSWVMKDYDSQPILRVVNAGILGGNDICFIQSYVEIIREFIEKNLSVIRNTNDGFINSLYEQLFFYLLAKNSSKSIGFCTEGDKLSTKFDWLPINLSYAPKTGYMHLLADIKRRLNTYVFVSRYLDFLSPDLSYRITRVCADNGIYPLINHPHLGIYCKKQSNRIDINTVNLLNKTHPIKGFNHSIGKIEDLLGERAKELALDMRSVTNILWRTDSLWNQKFKYRIAENIRISEVSGEQAKALLNRKINDRNGEKMYSVSIPDPMFMKIINLLINGIRVDIIDCLLSNNACSIEQIGNYIMSKTHDVGNLELFRVQIDGTIRGMLISGILKVEL